MTEMLIAAFRDSDQADKAVTALHELGYKPDEFSVISNETRRPKEALQAPAEGAASGALTGTAIGGLAGLLTGAGVLPGLAGLLIGGPIAVALGATGIAAATISGAVTGALAGGLIGALQDLGVQADVAQAYNDVVKEGGIVLAVPLTHDKQRVRDIFDTHGASDVSEVAIKTPTTSHAH